MKIKQTILLFLIAVFSFATLSFLPVSAETCGGVTLEAGQQCCGGVITTVIDCGDSTGSDISGSGLWKLLLLVINILTAGIGVAAVGGFVYAGVLYSSAGGNSDNIKKAKTMIANIIIGIVSYFLIYSLLNYLIPGGVFNT